MIDMIHGFVRENADDIISFTIGLVVAIAMAYAMVEIVSCSTHHVYY